ncbi:MAG: preprotein translocase subunit SecE [Spirochaetales bacterium]|nr:preprotein translocase subunit SecE [Spirochaetales bacterium]
MKRLIQYFKDSYAEMKKIMWPTRDEVSSSTVVVLVSVVFFGVMLGVIDFLLANAIELLF